ncbi:MAG: hypothetical protein RJB60_1932 [Pseudomonadota bacterium]|jgi:hypothetical protein
MLNAGRAFTDDTEKEMGAFVSDLLMALPDQH